MEFQLLMSFGAILFLYFSINYINQSRFYYNILLTLKENIDAESVQAKLLSYWSENKQLYVDNSIFERVELRSDTNLAQLVLPLNTSFLITSIRQLGQVTVNGPSTITIPVVMNRGIPTVVTV